MKVLILSQEFPPSVGGAGVVAWQNAKELSKRGYSVTVITRGKHSHKDNIEGIKLIESFGVRRLWPYFLLRRLRKLSLSTYDSIIINDIGAALVYFCLLKRKDLYHKTIYYLHGGEVEYILNDPRGYARFFRLRRALVEFIPRSRQVVAVSDYMKSYFIESLGHGLFDNKFSVIYSGADSSFFYPVKTDLFADLKSRGRTILLSVSRIVKAKGYEKMLHLFNDVVRGGFNLHWIIVGDGNYLDELKALSRKFGLEDFVTFVGTVPREELKNYYSAADLFWLLSDREAFGLVYIEAQLCGCPALGYASYGVPEAIEHGVTGFLLSDAAQFYEFIESGVYKMLERDKIARKAIDLSSETQVGRLEILLRKRN